MIIYPSIVENGGAPPPDQIRAQLELVLESRALRNSNTLRHLLDYLVTETLENRGEFLNATSVAEHLSGKGMIQNPDKLATATNEVGRLRQQLSTYYQQAGLWDEVLIDIPDKMFLPGFAYRRQGEDTEIETSSRSHGQRRLYWGLLAAIVLTGLALLI